MMPDFFIKIFSFFRDYGKSVLSKIRSYIANDPLVRGIVILGSGTMIAQVLGMVFVPVITRLYPPAIYGTLAVFISLVTILVDVSALRYELAIPIPEKDEEAEYLLVLAISILCILTFVLFLALLISGDLLAGIFHFEFMKPYYWLFCIGLFGISLYNILTYFAIRSKDYIKITHTKISQGISGSVSKVILGFLSFGSFGLICGEIIGRMAGVGTLGRTVVPKIRHVIKNFDRNRLKSVAQQYRKFPLYSMPATFINDISLQAPVLLLSTLFGFQVVGLYSLSYSILVYPVSMISGSIAQVHFGEISDLYRRKSPEILELYKKTTKRLFLFGAPVFFIGAIVSPLLFSFVFGHAWKDAGIFSLPLSFMVIGQFVVSSTDRLEMYGYNHWALIWNISRTVLVISGFFIAFFLHFTPIETILLYSVIMTIMYIVCYILNIEALKQIVKRNIAMNKA